MKELILIYLLIINAVAFLLMLADKLKAKKHLWRIPESTLMTSALLGGSVGALLGMYTARHKTKHKKFTIVVSTFCAQCEWISLCVSSTISAQKGGGIPNG